MLPRAAKGYCCNGLPFKTDRRAHASPPAGCEQARPLWASSGFLGEFTDPFGTGVGEKCHEALQVR